MKAFAARMKYAESTVPIAADPDDREVEASRQLVPAEDPEADEGRLEEEREQALERERRAEDVADEPGVLRPVHAELELLHDAGDDAHREVDEEDLAEEPREAEVLRLAGAIPGRLEDRQPSVAMPIVSGTNRKW